MPLAVDVSNYTSPLNVGDLVAAGVELVIVQAVDPPAPFPPSQTRQQLLACQDANCSTDAYVWLWFDADPSDIAHKLELLQGFDIRQLWLDVEDTAAAHLSQVETEAKIAAALEQLDAAGASKAGIYTGRWYWRDPLYVADSQTFADRPLYDAQYDGVADVAANFKPYGGWTARAIKQFEGTCSYAGVRNVDLDVLEWPS